MIRTTITPQQTDVTVSVPEEYVGKKLEMLLYAVDEIIEEAPKPTTMAQFWGILSPGTGQDILRHAEASRDEWDRNS